MQSQKASPFRLTGWRSARSIGAVQLLSPHPLSLAPFVLLVAALAVFPLLLKYQWEAHYNKLCAGLAAVTVLYYLVGLHAGGQIVHAALEYLSFLVVVATFFVVAGAIHLHIPRSGSPLTNAALLLGGSILANLIGTIGASLLLIHPFLHANRGRQRPMHIVFFILLVSNLGRCLRLLRCFSFAADSAA